MHVRAPEMETLRGGNWDVDRGGGARIRISRGWCRAREKISA